MPLKNTKSGLRSVTLVSQSSLLADALATAAFILGLEEGLELIRRYGLEAVFIDKKGHTYITSQLKLKGDFKPFNIYKMGIV